MLHNRWLHVFLIALLATLVSGSVLAQLKFSDNVYAEPGISVATYIDRLKHGTTEWQRYNAACALGELGDKSAIPALADALDSPSNSVRECAVSALGDLAAVGTIPHIAKLLRDSSPDARANAAYSLAELGAVEFIPEIESLFNDASPHVQASAREAVQYLKVHKK